MCHFNGLPLRGCLQRPCLNRLSGFCVQLQPVRLQLKALHTWKKMRVWEALGANVLNTKPWKMIILFPAVGTLEPHPDVYTPGLSKEGYKHQFSTKLGASRKRKSLSGLLGGCLIIKPPLLETVSEMRQTAEVPMTFPENVLSLTEVKETTWCLAPFTLFQQKDIICGESWTVRAQLPVNSSRSGHFQEARLSLPHVPAPSTLLARLAGSTYMLRELILKKTHDCQASVSHSHLGRT